MADEKVNLTVDVDVKGDNQLLAVAAKMSALGVANKKLADRTDRLTGAMRRGTIQMTQSKKGALSFTKQLSLLERVSGGLLKRARLLMFGVIALGIEFAVVAISLASVNAAFAVGNFLIKAYNYSMQALAGGIAAVGVAAIAAAAAFKEFQAAQFAFRYAGSKQEGSGLDQSAAGMRSLYKDATLASMGVQALAGAFAAVNKNSAFTGQSRATLKGLADFVQASGDSKNSLRAAGTLVGVLQKEKKFTAEALAAIKQISPEFEKAFNKGNYKEYRKFLEDIQSGKLAMDAGVGGQADTVGKTLFAQFKSMQASALVELSDVGVRVLEPVKKAMHDIYGGLERTFRRISNDLVVFGNGPFIDSLVAFTTKLEDFTVVLFRKFLPATEGFWKRTTGFFKGFAQYFREVRDALEPLRDGGSIIIKTFGKPIIEIFRQIGIGVKDLATMAEDNKANFLQFGESLKSLVTGFFQLMRGLKQAFASALPVINPFISALGKIIGFLGTLIKSISGLGGGVGGSLSSVLLGTLGVMAFKGRRAARFGRNKQLSGMGEFGSSPQSLKNVIYSGQSLKEMGKNAGGVAGVGNGPLSGAMAAQSVGAAASAALAPAATGLHSAGAGLSSAGASLQGAAAALAGAAGGALRGGMGGGAVDRTGQIKKLPNRKPGQSNADYRRDIYAYKTANPRQDLGPISERGYSSPGGMHGLKLTPKEKLRALMYKNTRAEFDRKDSGTQNIFGRDRGDPLLSLRGLNKEQYQELNRMQRSAATGGAPAFTPRGPRPMYGPALPYDAMGSAQMSRSQRIQSGFRASSLMDSSRTGLSSIRNFSARSFIKNSEFMNGKDYIAGRDGPNLSLSGATNAGGTAASAARGGFRGLIGRSLMGQQYATQGSQGFRKNASAMFGGGGVTAGYQNARNNFLELQKEGKLPADAKFSKRAGVKAGLKRGFGGASMLTGLATGALINSSVGEKYMKDEDAKSSMMTGAGLMAINPLLGLAVGAGLTAFKSKTKMGGMVAGAVSGAAIGGMIAGPLGVAVGGLVGAGLGALSANRNQNKMVKTAMQGVGSAQLSSIAGEAIKDAASGGGTGRARIALSASKNLSKDFAATRKFDDAGDSAGGIAARKKLLQPFTDAGILDGNALSLATGDKNKTAADEIAKVSNTMQEALGPAFNQFDSIMNSLKGTTGMASDEIYKLAMERNVDLYDTTLTLTEATRRLGIGMVKTSKQFSDALKDVAIKSMDVFRQFRESKAMKDAFQSSAENLRLGDTSVDATLDYYTKSGDLLNATSPSSPLLNAIVQAQQFGFGANVGKGSAFTTGPMAGTTINAEAGGLISQSQTQTASGSATEMTKQIMAMAGAEDFAFEDADKAFKGSETAIKALIDKAMGGDQVAMQKVKDLEQVLNRGTAFKGKGKGDIVNQIGKLIGTTSTAQVGTGTGSAGAAPTIFGVGLKDELSGQLDPFAKVLSAEAAAMRKEFFEAAKSGFFTDKPDWWDRAPKWWDEGFQGIYDRSNPPRLTRLESIGDTANPKYGAMGDTSSARNLKNTLGKHSALDGSVPGKRTVTSSLRNFALGSTNSDHATGNAYDLVGQNLGAYSSMINAAGGFADFHGSAASRHLHVVPPVGPMGDTYTSVLAKMSGNMSSSPAGGDTFNITVNESSSPQVTAQAVAAQILQIQKNWKQRS